MLDWLAALVGAMLIALRWLLAWLLITEAGWLLLLRWHAGLTP